MKSPFNDAVFASTVLQPDQRLLLHRAMHDNPHVTDAIAALLDQVELEIAGQLHGSTATPETIRGSLRGVRLVRAKFTEVFGIAPPAPTGSIDNSPA